MTYENQRKKKGSTFDAITSYKAPLTNKQGPRAPWPRSPTPHPVKPTTTGPSASAQPKPRAHEAGKSKRDAKDVVCYRCNGFGHMQAECPNKKAFTVREWIDIQTKPTKRVMLVETEEGEEILCQMDERGTLNPCVNSDTEEASSEEGEEHEKLPPEEQYSMVIRKNFHTAPIEKKHEQRENIFQTKCRVKDEVCDVIIDSGSETNCVDRRLVERLGLSTSLHPKPYKLRWLDDNCGQRVRKQCLVNLKIGTYQDEILCDVLNMDACHILLGRPWQHDTRARHDGYTNVYTIKDKGRTGS